MLWLVHIALAAPAAIEAQRGGDLSLDEAMPPCTTLHTTKKRRFSAARASSELKEGRTTHTALRAIDGELSTAWVEGVEGTGVGETLRVKLDGEGQMPHGLWIVPGYARDSARWTKNQRVSVLEVRFLKAKEDTDPSNAWESGSLVSTHTEPMIVTLQLDGGRVPMEGQAIPLAPYFHQNMEASEIVALELAIVKTDGKAATYQDTCISEVAQLETAEERSVTCAAGWCEGPGRGHKGCP